MGTLYIDRKDIVVKVDGNALAFYSAHEREGSVPIAPLKRVIMAGNITTETRALSRLALEGVSVLFLSGKRLKFSGMLHGRLHNNGLLRVRQYEKSLTNFALEAACDLVRRKAVAQCELLMSIREVRSDLRYPLTQASGVIQRIISGIEQEMESMKDPASHTYAKLEDNTSFDRIRGLEGGASAAYFSAFTKVFPGSLKFINRNRRPPKDPVNAMLSLCYTMLHFEMVREIEIIGLDPVIGFYHQFDYGRESLACDLVEPFRPVIDKFVWELFRGRTLTERDFAMEDERPGCYLKKKSRKKFYPLYEDWAKTMRPQWVEEVRGLARRILNGQDTVYQPEE